MSQNYWLSVLFWFLSLPALIAQADSSFVLVNARLIDAKTNEDIPFAHIILLSEEKGLTSDENGGFYLYSRPQDTLVISSVGYEMKKIPVKVLKTDSLLNTILLSPKVYMLDEIMVTQFPSYEKLTEIVVNPVLTFVEKEIFRVDKKMEEVGLCQVASESGEKGAGGPISAIYNLFSRNVKNQKKYEALVKEDKVKLKHHKRFNRDVVQGLTGLTDSIKIIQFMKYCNFDDAFLNNSSDYELLMKVKQKFNTFKLN